ncbi:hypothetical protein K491DRAFT_38051 [Lophiostoma macrostomum CBS 122681]|uniref:Uncharacterized protein n=1 Tax=Lophiostoma macrostomum CBS 122681 TaxID=1314788 RepID=A0A6A6TKQ8_9PLEO|nr:hypothetical protein K491DRAFT_38051 [Lophiostoma macrostomum CBS 122681]
MALTTGCSAFQIHSWSLDGESRRCPYPDFPRKPAAASRPQPPSCFWRNRSVIGFLHGILPLGAPPARPKWFPPAHPSRGWGGSLETISPADFGGSIWHLHGDASRNLNTSVVSSAYLISAAVQGCRSVVKTSTLLSEDGSDWSPLHTAFFHP